MTILSMITIKKRVNIKGKSIDILHRGDFLIKHSKLIPKQFLILTSDLMNTIIFFHNFLNYVVVTKSVKYLFPQVCATRSDSQSITHIFTNEIVIIFFMEEIGTRFNETGCYRGSPSIKLTIHHSVRFNSFKAIRITNWPIGLEEYCF